MNKQAGQKEFEFRFQYINTRMAGKVTLKLRKTMASQEGRNRNHPNNVYSAKWELTSNAIYGVDKMRTYSTTALAEILIAN